MSKPSLFLREIEKRKCQPREPCKEKIATPCPVESVSKTNGASNEKTARTRLERTSTFVVPPSPLRSSKVAGKPSAYFTLEDDSDFAPFLGAVRGGALSFGGGEAPPFGRRGGGAPADFDFGIGVGGAPTVARFVRVDPPASPNWLTVWDP